MTQTGSAMPTESGACFGANRTAASLLVGPSGNRPECHAGRADYCFWSLLYLVMSFLVIV